MPEPTLSVSKSASIAPLLGGLARRAVLAQLRQLRHGSLRLISHGQQWTFGDVASRLYAEVEIVDDAAWGLVAGNGSIGAGEGYIHGYWRSPDLAAVTRLFVANLDVLDAMEGGLARLAREDARPRSDRRHGRHGHQLLAARPATGEAARAGARLPRRAAVAATSASAR